MTVRSDPLLNKRLAEQDNQYLNFSNAVIRQQNHQNYTNMSERIENKDDIFRQSLNEQYQPRLFHLKNGLEGQARKQFIIKVYLIIGLQLFITLVVSIISYCSYDFMKFQIDNYALLYVAIGLMLVTQIMVLCSQIGRRHPYNFIALLIFTLGQAYIISFITSVTAESDESEGAIVLTAAIMTLILVASLTFYAIITKRDFASGMAILVAFIASTLMFWLFFFINWTSTAQIFYSSIGIFVFGLYLVIDTQLIMGGRKIALSIDDYVVAALLLYIDIIQIFLYILSLLTNKNRR